MRPQQRSLMLSRLTSRIHLCACGAQADKPAGCCLLALITDALSKERKSYIAGALFFHLSIADAIHPACFFSLLGNAFLHDYFKPSSAFKI
jgi:hypothetical protein